MDCTGNDKEKQGNEKLHTPEERKKQQRENLPPAVDNTNKLSPRLVHI